MCSLDVPASSKARHSLKKSNNDDWRLIKDGKKRLNTYRLSDVCQTLSWNYIYFFIDKQWFLWLFVILYGSMGSKVIDKAKERRKGSDDLSSTLKQTESSHLYNLIYLVP